MKEYCTVKNRRKNKCIRKQAWAEEDCIHLFSLCIWYMNLKCLFFKGFILQKNKKTCVHANKNLFPFFPSIFFKKKLQLVYDDLSFFSLLLQTHFDTLWYAFIQNFSTNQFFKAVLTEKLQLWYVICIVVSCKT